MKEYIKLTAPSKKRTIWTCILSTMLLLSIYLGIFHQYHLDGSLLFWLGSTSLIYLNQLWIDTSKMNWIKHLLPFLILIILGLSVITIGKLQKVYYAYQLANNSQTVTGEVVLVKTHEFPEFDFYYRRYAKVIYRFNNKNFIQKIDNKKQQLILGDTIKLKISTQHPEIVEAVY